MKHTPVLILAGDAGWLPLLEGAVGEEDCAGLGDEGLAAGFMEDVGSVVAALKESSVMSGSIPGAGVVIGLASHRCFAARVSTEGLPARQLRQALPYRFETAVPFAVEDLVLDTCGRGDERLVVATHADPLWALVHELEDAGVRVCGIAPLALLAAQSADLGEAPDGTEVTLAEPASLSTAEVASVSRVTCAGVGNVRAWRWLPKLANEPEVRAEVEETLRLAQATTRRVVAEEETLWVDLQQGPLASRHRLERVRRPLTALIAAAALFLIAMIGVMQVRAWQYQAIAATHDDQARALYADAFPGEAVPVSMQRRLTTRLRELRGRQGLATPDARLFDEQNTLAILHDLIDRLPGDTRLVIIDLRLDGDRIDLVGQARSHSDADTLAAALRRDGRFEVTPPSTENLPTQGVQFSLNLVPQSRPGNADSAQTDALVAEQVGTDGGTP